MWRARMASGRNVRDPEGSRGTVGGMNLNGGYSEGLENYHETDEHSAADPPPIPSSDQYAPDRERKCGRVKDELTENRGKLHANEQASAPLPACDDRMMLTPEGWKVAR